MVRKTMPCFELMFLFWILLNGICIIGGKVNDELTSPNHRLSSEELKSYLTKLLSQNSSFRFCPAPKLPLEENDCKLTTCRTDDDCQSTNKSCCFNGCIFTCVTKMSPPPVIDWDDEHDVPTLRKEGEAVVRCTTSPRPAPSEPVGCPKGYICKIDDYGDPIEGRYNSGVCVPEPSAVEIGSEKEDPSGLKEKTGKETGRRLLIFGIEMSCKVSFRNKWCCHL
ncbi:WAP four-disulfide core domain protein 1-like [Stegodyphus dumicola]|uniref:WAP four-disulfide core domain protein 1-like n=1 Tax=Stegodyphus dumicola TaxID=202533 RepID=UPI0015AAFEF5|nr:WAP four-disulfide core domain protein 1-like [Stegodyphus dumicola]